MARTGKRSAKPRVKAHAWTESDDLAALYLYKYGDSRRRPTVEGVARAQGMSRASLLKRIANFRAIDGGAGLRNWSRQSEAVYRAYGKLSEAELRALAVESMGYVAASAAARCAEKRRYETRLAAESALGVARNQWRRDRTRAPRPPVRVYQCPECGYGWHLTSQSEQLRTPLRTGPAPALAAPPGSGRGTPTRRKRTSSRRTAAQTRAAAGAFERGERVTYLGGAKAKWLRAGSALTVLGPVRSRGRGYVRLVREGDGRRTTLAPHLIRASA